MPRPSASVLVLAALTGLPGPLGAQDVPVERAVLPPEVAAAVVAFHNDSSTVRFTGRSTLPRGAVLVANASVLGGPFLVGGRIEGDLLVINGDLRLEPSARITGDVTLVGGRVVGAEAGMVGGAVSVFETPLTYTFRGDGIAFVERARRDGVSSPLGFGRSRFTVRAGRNYNRVEGLPVVFGPILETGSRNPLRIEALGTWRTESGLDLRAQDLGYHLRFEQAMGGRDEVALGVAARSEMVPIETWGLTDLEASLATFLLHDDFRDYYEAEGWNAFLAWRPRRLPLTLGLEYREDRHRQATPGGPWSLRDNDQPWRPQPAVAEGSLRSSAAILRIDTRNDVRSPSDGWLVDASLRRSLGGTLTLPDLLLVDPTEPGGEALERPRQPVARDFLHGFLDIRRYARVGPTSTLSLRALTAGAPGDGSLPPQFQHAAGGAGTLPGHASFALDCRARSVETVHSSSIPGEPPPVGADVLHPAYGCDRLVAFQAEFRALLPVEIPRDTSAGNLLGILELTPSWYLFANAARGWATPGPPDVPPAFRRTDSAWRSDAGAGIALGSVGAQVAFPFQGDGGATFTIRVSHRF